MSSLVDLKRKDEHVLRNIIIKFSTSFLDGPILFIFES